MAFQSQQFVPGINQLGGHIHTFKFNLDVFTGRSSLSGNRNILD